MYTRLVKIGGGWKYEEAREILGTPSSFFLPLCVILTDYRDTKKVACASRSLTLTLSLLSLSLHSTALCPLLIIAGLSNEASKTRQVNEGGDGRGGSEF